MPPKLRAKIAYLGPSLSSSPHLNKIRAFIPKDIEVIFEQLVLHDGRLSDVQGKLDLIVSKALELSEKHKCDGLIFPGAPREVLNPGLFARLTSSLKIPVATALRSSAAALRAFSAKRILLMTPFDDSLNKLIRDFLADLGIDAVSPSESLRHYTDALKLTPNDVESLVKTAFARHPRVDAIYFQGAVLDPIGVLGKMENELKIPVVASNPAMLWFNAFKTRAETSDPGLRETFVFVACPTERLMPKRKKAKPVKVYILLYVCALVSLNFNLRPENVLGS